VSYHSPLPLPHAVAGVSPQLDSCPELQQDLLSTCSFNNCTSLTCSFSEAESLTFVVDACVDPTHVLVTIRNDVHELEAQRGFDRSGVINLVGGVVLSVNMSRNATHLDFSVSGEGKEGLRSEVNVTSSGHFIV
jgi:hypothetical protein